MTRVISFGHHKGKTWAWAAHNDPDYLWWLITNSDHQQTIKLAQEALAAAGTAAGASPKKERVKEPGGLRRRRYGVAWLDDIIDAGSESPEGVPRPAMAGRENER